MSKSKIPGLSFSWKRALGITKMKSNWDSHDQSGAAKKTWQTPWYEVREKPSAVSATTAEGFVQTARSGRCCMI